MNFIKTIFVTTSIVCTVIGAHAGTEVIAKQTTLTCKEVPVEPDTEAYSEKCVVTDKLGNWKKKKYPYELTLDVLDTKIDEVGLQYKLTQVKERSGPMTLESAISDVKSSSLKLRREVRVEWRRRLDEDHHGMIVRKLVGFASEDSYKRAVYLVFKSAKEKTCYKGLVKTLKKARSLADDGAAPCVDTIIEEG